MCGRCKISGEVVDMAVEPGQRTHRVGVALRMIARRICSMENPRLDERPRRARDRGTEGSRQIRVAVVARDAVGAIDHLAAIGGAQLARLATGRSKGDTHKRRYCDAHDAPGDETHTQQTCSGCATTYDRFARGTATVFKHRCADAAGEAFSESHRDAHRHSPGARPGGRITTSG